MQRELPLMVAVVCAVLLAVVFAWGAVAKSRAAGFGSLRSALRRLGLGRAATPAAAALVVAEAGVALSLVNPWTADAGLVAAGLLSSGLAAGVGWVLWRGLRVDCACFGSGGVRIDRWHLGRNVALSAAALAGLASTSTSASVTGAGLAVAIVAGGVLAVVLVRIEDVAFLFRSQQARRVS